MNIKPVRPKKMPVARPVAIVPVVLTSGEAELLRCYRTMDLRRRNELFMHAESQAKRYPIVKPPAAPTSIRLVANAGKRVNEHAMKEVKHA